MTERLDKEAASSEAEPLDPETESSSFPSRGISRTTSQSRLWLDSSPSRGAKNAAEKPSPMPGKRRKPTLFATIKGSFAETKKMWQNRYKNIAKFIAKFTKALGQLLCKVQKKWDKIGRKWAQIPKSVHLDTCNLRIVSAIMRTSKGSQTRDCFRQKYNRRRIRLPPEDTRVRRPAATAFAHGRCTMKVSEAKQKSWQNRSDPAAQS